jgi:outer membrane protein assembly factor BamD (BamD/ComL family)
VARFKRSDKTEQAAENIEMLKQRLSGGSLSVARFYDKAGNYPAALVYYNEVLSQSPDSPQGQEAKQRKRVLEDLLTEAKQQTTPPNLSKISLRHQAEPRSVPPQ